MTSGPLPAPTVPALLVAVAGAQAARVNSAFADAGLEGLRAGQAQVLVPLAAGPRRITDLARVLGVSRQAVAQAVNALARSGYVERTTDPDDRRASLVRLTLPGWRALREMRRVALEVERTWSRRLGDQALADLRVALEALLDLAGSSGGRHGRS